MFRWTYEVCYEQDREFHVWWWEANLLYYHTLDEDETETRYFYPRNSEGQRNSLFKLLTMMTTLVVSDVICRMFCARWMIHLIHYPWSLQRTSDGPGDICYIQIRSWGNVRVLYFKDVWWASLSSFEVNFNCERA